MAVQQAVRIVCDGCGLEAEWRPRGRGETVGETTQDARDCMTLAHWQVRPLDDKDLCPLCVRCEKQDGRLVDEAVQKGGV